MLFNKKINYRKIYEDHHGRIPVDEFNRTYEIHHVDGDRSNNDISNLVALSIQDHYNTHYSQNDWAACLVMSERMKISPAEKSELSRKVQLERIEAGTHTFQNQEFIAKHTDRQKKMIEANEHPFQRPDVIAKIKTIASEIQSKKVEAGTHQFQDESVRSRAIEASKLKNAELISQGKHIFQDKVRISQHIAKQFAEGKHPTQNSEMQRQKTIKRVENGSHPWVQENYQSDLNHRMLAEGKHSSQKKLTCAHCNKTVDTMNYRRWHDSKCKKLKS